MEVSALIFNYLHVALVLHYWQTSGTADSRESMTLNGQASIIASVAAKGRVFPDDVDAPECSVTAKVTALRSLLNGDVFVGCYLQHRLELSGDDSESASRERASGSSAPEKVNTARSPACACNEESNKMKLHYSITLASLAPGILHTTSAGAVAQDVGSDASKSAKSRCYATVKVAKKTAAGTTIDGNTPSAREYAAKRTGQRG